MPLKMTLKFNRLAALSQDTKVIAEALEKSVDKLVEVNENKTKIRRNPNKPLYRNSLQRIKSQQNRSAYAKGFLLDFQLNDIINFTDQYDLVDSVIRHIKKKKQI
ncbi:hypothetical protein ABEB36_011556 [Hypothenemus hampei]|uniref:HTH La-type RNA-binding domain-containing protein n=1 Tax=Hypothenemus hampei TaxID=57062 RepID=A0ABD1E8I6_HYPHA